MVHCIFTLEAEQDLKNIADYTFEKCGLSQAITYSETLDMCFEKTATFFGFKDFSACIHGMDDEVLYARALNFLSHGQYSIYEPNRMVDDNKELFKSIFTEFINRYKFDLPDITKPQKETQ